MAGMAIEDTGARKRGLLLLSLTLLLWLNLQLTQMPTMDMGTAVATMAGMAEEDTGAMVRGLLWLSLTPLLNPNLTDTDIAPMATTGPMGTGAGEGRRDLPSPTMDMDMDIAVATMAATVADIGAKPNVKRATD